MARIFSKCPREKCAACHTESFLCLSTVKLRESQSLEKLSLHFLQTPQPLATASFLEVLKGNALAEGTLLHFHFSQKQTFKFSSQWFSLCRRRIPWLHLISVWCWSFAQRCWWSWGEKLAQIHFPPIANPVSGLLIQNLLCTLVLSNRKRVSFHHYMAYSNWKPRFYWAQAHCSVVLLFSIGPYAIK